MANRKRTFGKGRLLSSTALTRHLATFGALGLAFSATSAHALDANALPTGANVVGGNATFTQSGATLTVNQTTNRTVIDWRSFNIGSNATTNFVQPGASSIAVNRVNGSTNPTEIQGSLNANGQVWILNPNGVFFGKNAKIDVAGILASTANIDANAFMRGDNRLQFTGGDSGSVENAGLITVADGGLAAFVAPAVRNSGVIRARLGKVTLAAGTTYTLDLAGDQLVELGIGSNDAVVDQSGQVLADGSIVTLTAKAATEVVDSVVNVSGTVQASGIEEKGGKIILTADNVTTGPDATLAADGGTKGDGGSIYAYADQTGTYNGSFSAKGGSASGNGGSVETSGKKVQIASSISVNTTAPNGSMGDWSIDPTNLIVESSSSGTLTGSGDQTNDETGTISAATIEAGLASNNVILQADNSITVNEDIVSSGTGNLSLNDQDGGGLDIYLNALISLSGAGQTLSGEGTTVNVGASGSIQNGVDVASTSGATVNVADGNYAENVTINKSNLTLLSENGSGSTTITGQVAGSELGTIFVTSGSNDFTLGGLGQGFTIIGIDGTPGLEKAAVYFQGANAGSKVQGNIIRANGDAGLMSESGGAVTYLTIDNNTFDGQTFTGATAGDLGFSNQFTAANVPRQLVVLGSGAGTTTTNNIVFTNNDVTGTAGALNSSDQEQGNTLVTIDAADVTITGNTFAGTTTRYGDALRARGSNTTITGNTFDGTNMGMGTNLVDLRDGALSGSFADMVAANTWKNAAWVDRLHTGYNYVYRSVQNAIADAIGGDTVNVAGGTYAGTVVIDKGLTLQGTDSVNRASLTDGIQLTGTYSDLTLKNLVVSGDGGGNKVVSGGHVTNLTVDNVKIDGGSVASRFGFAGGKFYGDISITNSQFANINGWSAFDNSTGGSPTALTSVVFSNNLLDNVQGHIAFRQLNPTDVTISGNIVQNTGDATNSFGGIFKVFNSSTGGTVDFTDNYVSGIGTSGFNPAGEAAYGAALLVRNVETLNISGNTFINNNQVFAVEPGKALPTTTTFTDNSFTNNGYVIYTPTNVVAGGAINFVGTNNIISGLDTVQDVVWREAAGLDMTNVEFDGKLGSAMTQAELFALEDEITHGVDDGTSGLITVKSGNVYVTQSSGSIANGVAKATTGDTVNVGAGTYGSFGTSFGGASDLTIQTVDGAVIDGSTRPSNNRIVDLRADGTTFSGFTINNGGGNGVGVSVSGQGVTVSGNNISDVLTGVQTTTQYSAGNATISGNTINAKYGVSLQNTGNEVSGNDVTASVEGVGLLTGLNTFTDNTFHIGSSANALVLYSSASANDLTSSGNTVNIEGGALQGAVYLAGTDGYLNLAAGTYGLSSTLYLKNDGLSVTGADEVNTVINSTAAGYGIAVQGDGITLSKFTFNNTNPNGYYTRSNTSGASYAVKVSPLGAATELDNFSINDVTINDSGRTGLDLNGVNGATIDHVTVDGSVYGNGITLTDSKNVGITNSITTNNTWGGLALYQSNTYYNLQVTGITVDGTNSFANGVYAQDQSATNDFGTIDLTGLGIQYVASISTGGSDGDYWFFQSTEQGALNLADAFNTRYSQTGAVVQGYNESGKSVDGNGAFYVGHSTDSGNALSIAAAQAASSNGATINVGSGTYTEDVTIGDARVFNFDGSTLNSFTQNVASTIGGALTTVGNIALNALTTLASNTVLNGTNVSVASVDGAGHTFEIGSGATALTGSSYQAAGLTFGGTGVTLSQANTAFDTSSVGGNITFNAPIFGTTNAAQSIVLNAGPGTGGSANGDILLQNVGLEALKLGSMTVSGHDLTANTVWLAKNYTSTLTGNQTFSTETLHVGGNATSNVGGNATGPIVSGGTVNVSAGGNFSGNVTAPNSTISAQNISGTFTGANTTLNATNSVNVTTDVSNLTVDSPSGTVNGTFDNYTSSGGPIVVNGKTRSGSSETNPNQIVVEGFTLPNGAIVTSTGEIVLPSGMLVGLVSPAAGPGAEGGKPKVIIVHTVMKLGELLSQGYVAIIVDLNKQGDDEEVVAMN